MARGREVQRKVKGWVERHGRGGGKRGDARVGDNSVLGLIFLGVTA